MTGFYSRSFFILSVAVLLSGCNVAISTNNTMPAKSKIIEQVEAAGSGPVEKASMDSLFKWFRNRMDLALAINKQCKEIRPTAAAAWRDTPEGRVCEVTAKLAAFRGQ